MTGLHWVIGSGGLLGSAVVRRLRGRGERVFVAPAISWADDSATSTLSSALTAFLADAGTQRWTIYWCAGAAVTDSAPAILERELSTLTSLLSTIESHPMRSVGSGAFYFAGSAGAAYGGSTGAPFTEESVTKPLGRYGAAKLVAEQVVARFSQGSGIPAVVGRISNLYGPGQSLAKQQGLISRLCYSHLTRSPLSVFVPMDTLRDYIYVDDCADQIIATASRIRAVGGFQLKLIISGRALSIAAVLGAFRQVTGKRPLIVSGSSPAAALQSSDLRLQSTRWHDISGDGGVGIVDGMARTLTDMQISYMNAGLDR